MKTMDLPGSPDEDAFHVSVAELLDLILIPPAFFTTFPSGYGKLGKATAGRLFAKGLKKGMPDILVFDKNRKVVGIELKAGRNGVTSAQRTMHAKLMGCNIHTYVCRTLEEVVMAIHREGVSYKRINLCQLGTNESGQQLDLPMERSAARP